jgi:hypothetical protein
LEGKPTKDGLEIVRAMIDSPVFASLEKSQLSALEGLLEVLGFVFNNTPDGRICYNDITSDVVLTAYEEDVRGLLAQVVGRLDQTEPPWKPQPPFAAWQSLRELVQRDLSARQARSYLEALENKKTTEELVKSHQKIEPPTTVAQEKGDQGVLKTALDLSLEALQDPDLLYPLRLSSGFPTLDYALTNPADREVGFVSLGENVIIVAPSGTGKSAFSYSLVVALTMSMVNHGKKDGIGIFAHTEEATFTKLKVSRLLTGQKYHYLAKNLVVENVNASRKRLVTLCYQAVLVALEKSKVQKRPITDFLPYFFVLDYLQSITEKGENKNQATDTTSELLIRGIQEWDPESMHLYGGVSFQEFAGIPWPSGMEKHRVATIAFAQIRKGDTEKTTYYRPGMDISDFALQDEQGSGSLWEVKEGDMRMYHAADIAYSSTIRNNATNIIFLHRSKAYNGAVMRYPNGEYHLPPESQRARIILEKTRNGSRLAAVPMTFDSDHAGMRGHWYDLAGVKIAAEAPELFDESYETPEDPLVPRSKKINPFQGVKY